MMKRLAQPAELSLRDQVTRGQQVKELIEHPGFAVLCAALDVKADLKVASVQEPTWEAARYADAIGQAKGLRAIGPVANSVITGGKKAGQRIRELEEAGQVS